VLSRGVRVHSYSVVEDSIIFPDVEIGEKAHIRRTVIDRGVKIKPGDRIGFDLDADRKRFTVSDTGIVVISQPSNNPVV
jgi:glucose-1-phosphate adenylyltransferase